MSTTTRHANASTTETTPTDRPTLTRAEKRARFERAPKTFSATNHAPLPPAFEDEWASGSP